MGTIAEKILTSPRQLAQVLESIDRPLVFTNGCFDILHRGHVEYLETAAALGQVLLVAINSDLSVKRLDKGPGRPFNNLDDRMAVVASLACVNYVVPFETDTPITLIEHIKPDHLVKGGDWAVNKIVGASLVLETGGQVHSLPIRHPVSTSALIDRILLSNKIG